jgi:RNA polymerase sigma factor (sigma-70 family)
VITSTVAPPSQRADSGSLSRYLRQVRQVAPLDSLEERRLAVQVRRGDGPAARRLVTAHLGTVVRIAWRYRRLHPSTLELIQEGNLALVRAVQRYDPARSASVSTYVGAWIRTCIARFVLASLGLGRQGRQGRTEPLTAPSALRRLLIEMHERWADRHPPRRAPLTDVASSFDESPFLPFEESALLTRLSALLPRFAEGLPVREVGILRERVLRDPPRTLAEQGKELGITAERVRQIELSLIARLRDRLLSAGVRDC